MRTGIRIEGLERLRKRYAEAPKIVGPEMRKALRNAGETLVAEVKPFVPVDTGASRRSVAFRMDNVNSVRIRGRLTNVSAGVRSLTDQKRLMLFLEKGTRPHPIRVGDRVFQHPGTPAFRPFERGFKAALPRMRRIFAAAHGRVTRAIGRK
jgi:hypothetical protein